MRILLLLIAASAWAQTSVTLTGPLKIPNAAGWNGEIAVSNSTGMCGTTQVFSNAMRFRVTNGIVPTIELYATTDCGDRPYIVTLTPDRGAPQSAYWVFSASPTTQTIGSVQTLATTFPTVPPFAIGQVSGLQAALDAITAGVSATFAALTGVPGDNAALASALGGKADTSHAHIISNTTGLQSALDGKSATTHSHAGVYAEFSHVHLIAGVTGLQSALDGKEPTITAASTDPTLKYWRGDKSWQTLNTLAVAELTNLYHTDARARAALVSTGSAAPEATPAALGLTYIETTTPLVYVSVCTTSSACWRDVASSTGLANEAVTFTSQTTVTIPHSYNSSAVIVQCQDGSGIEVQGSTDTSDLNNAVVTFAVAQSGRCKANASGGGGTGGTSDPYVLPTPTTTVMGGVKRNTGAAGEYVAGVDTDGSLIYSTPAGTGGGGTTYTSSTTVIVGTGSNGCPSGQLCVNGTVIPTTQCQSVTPPAWSSIASGRYQTQTVAATGFLDVDAVFVGAHNTLAAGLFALARAGNNTVDITVINMTAGALTPATLAFKVCFARHF